MSEDLTTQEAPAVPSTTAAAATAVPQAAGLVACQPIHRKLPNERKSITHKFTIAGHEGYVTVGMFEDGTPGELFITMAKEGSTISGLMDAFAIAISYCLQYGVPLKFLADKFSHVRFEPSGWTGNPQINHAKSITDYIFRWLALKFLGDTVTPPTHPPAAVAAEPQQRLPFPPARSDAPICPECGGLMVATGTCAACVECGTSAGCS